MIHHGSEGGLGPANVGTDAFNGFVDFIVKPYFSFLPGDDPVLWSAIHDYIEFIGGICIALGFLTRLAAFPLFVTLCSAVRALSLLEKAEGRRNSCEYEFGWRRFQPMLLFNKTFGS